jgi:hypothetical protein
VAETDRHRIHRVGRLTKRSGNTERFDRGDKARTIRPAVVEIQEKKPPP